MTCQDVAGRIAHDLKATLSPIRTSAYVLRQGRNLPDATYREVLDVIERQTGRLAKMIDEVIDWQRATAGTLVVRRAIVEVDILMGLVEGSLDEAPVVQWSPGRVPALLGDRHRLEQMLVALIECSARRDPTAPPQVEVTSTADHVCFNIRDRGPPADLVALASIPLDQDAQPGLGLGVILAKAIAEAHDGELRLHARHAGGVRFECVMPAAI